MSRVCWEEVLNDHVQRLPAASAFPHIIPLQPWHSLQSMGKVPAGESVWIHRFGSNLGAKTPWILMDRLWLGILEFSHHEFSTTKEIALAEKVPLTCFEIKSQQVSNFKLNKIIMKSSDSPSNGRFRVKWLKAPIMCWYTTQKNGHKSGSCSCFSQRPNLATEREATGRQLTKDHLLRYHLGKREISRDQYWNKLGQARYMFTYMAYFTISPVRNYPNFQKIEILMYLLRCPVNFTNL